MTFGIEESNRNAAFIQDADGYDVAVINRVESDDPNHQMHDQEWQRMIDFIAAAPRAFAILRTINEYEDDRPAEGTRGADIYHDVVELLNEFDTPDPGSEPSDDVSQYLPDDDEPPLRGEGEVVINQSSAQYRETFRDELYRRCGILLADIEDPDPERREDELEIASAYKAGQSVADAITQLSGELALHDADEDLWCEEWTGQRPDKK